MRIAALTLIVGLTLPLLGAAEERPLPPLRFGIQTPNQNTSWDDLLATWKDAEALGFDSAWVYDHFIPIFGNEDGGHRDQTVDGSPTV